MAQQRVTDTKDPRWGQIVTDTKDPNWGLPVTDVKPPEPPAPPPPTGKSHGPVLDALWNAGRDSVTGRVASAALDTVVGGLRTADTMQTEFNKGALKSVLTPIIGGGQLIRSALGMKPAVEDPYSIKVPINPEAENEFQQIGKTVGEVAQYFVPATKIGKAQAALKTGKGVLDALVKAGLEGTAAAGVHTVQAGNTEGAIDTGALTAAGGLTASVASRVLAKPVGWLGERIERALLKPTTPVLNGQTPSALVKKVYAHDVGGTLGQTYDKVATKLQNRVQHLRGILRQSSTMGGNVDLDAIAQQTSQDFLDNPQAKQMLVKIADHVKFQLNASGIRANAVLDLADGNLAKQAVGDLGAWTHGMRGNTVGAVEDINILEQVANKYYDRLKTAIESQSLGPVKAINKELGDLMEIRQAVVRRIPVAERQNVLSLTDNLNLSAHTFGIGLVNRLLGSGRVANALVKSGDAMRNAAPEVGVVSGRLMGSAVPRVTYPVTNPNTGEVFHYRTQADADKAKKAAGIR